MPQRTIRIALIDLYNGIPNEGIRAITESVHTLRAQNPEIEFTFDRFDTRVDESVPGLEYDIYISSGGPGSPFDGEGERWEENYFAWLGSVLAHNEAVTTHSTERKHVLFICHSFQMMCRYFGLAEVTRRRTPSFGILKVHKTTAGQTDPLFEGLPDPFYAGDFRSFQVIHPDIDKLDEMGATIIALEKERPHVDLERAVMGIRLSREMVGVQFHPEADPPGMRVHFEKPDRKEETIKKHSLEKYLQIMERLDAPDYLEATHRTVIPNFYQEALNTLTSRQPELTTDSEQNV